MNHIVADEINVSDLPFTPASCHRSLRRHIDLLVTTMPDALASPARVLLEEVALSYSRALERGSGPSADSCTRVRAAAENWAAAGMPLDRIVTEFGDLAARLADPFIGRRAATGPQLCTVMAVGNALMREVLAGANGARRVRGERPVRHATKDLVLDLIAGREPPPEASSRLAPAYLIVVVNWQENASMPQLGKIARECGGPGTLVGAAAEFVALIPDRGPLQRHRVLDDLAEQLAGRVWAGVACRERTAIPDGRREAVDILKLVVAGGREAGVYRLEDCLVEYAVSRNERVAESLVSIVAPLNANPVLRETLEALIRADFNRNVAAKRMFVHRSTLDYRLRRIEEVTGCDPMSNRDAQVLCAAMTAHGLARLSAVSQRDEGRATTSG